MRAALAKGLLALPLAWMLMGAALVDPPSVEAPVGLTTKDVGTVLRVTLNAREWKIVSDTGAVVVATLYVRTHSLTMRFTQDDHLIKINYVGSENLAYEEKKNGEKEIHNRYVAWTQYFNEALRTNFQMALALKQQL